MTTADAAQVLVILAHPYPERSRANNTLASRAADVEGVQVRSLYDLYPAFDIDVAAEQAALVATRAVVWQHPIYWYSVPGLLKHWFDKVLVRGFAYGEGGTALHGKRCLWVPTAGGNEAAYSASGMHARPFEEYVPVIEQTARFCGMIWEPPLVVKAAHQVKQKELEQVAVRYRERLEALVAGAESPA